MKVVRLGDRVARSNTKIVYEDRSVTFRHKDRIWIGCHVQALGLVMRMNLEIC